MSQFLTLLMAWIAGIGLGVIFFGGLWYTIRKGLASTQPALWFISSLLLRTSIVLVGLFYVYNLHCDRLFLCLVGFAMAGLTSTWLTQARNQTKERTLKGDSHAP